MKNCLIIGASGHAKVIIDIIESQNAAKIMGLLDLQHPIGARIKGYAIIGRQEQLPQLMTEYAIDEIVVAIGDNFIRQRVVESIRQNQPTLRFLTAIHPRATVAANVAIGEGSVIMAGVTVNSDAVIGAHCILNSNSVLEHDALLEDFASLAPQAAVGGATRIGVGAAVGMGASVIQCLTIGKHCVVAAGAAVIDSVEDLMLVGGVPAKIIRSRSLGEKYF